MWLLKDTITFQRGVNKMDMNATKKKKKKKKKKTKKARVDP